MLKRRVQFLWVKFFSEKVQIFWSHSKKKVQFFASYSRKKEGSILWVIMKKSSILSVIFTKGSILWVIFSEKKRFNSLSHVKKVQFCESSWKESIFEHMFKKKESILWVICCKKFQFFESFDFFKKNLWIIFEKLWVILTKGSILWIISKTKKFNSLESYLKKKVQFSREKRFNSFWVIFRIKKRFNSFWVIFREKKDSILLSHISKKKVQIFESYFFWKKKVQ